MSSIIQFMSMQLGEQLASYLKLLRIYIFWGGTEIGKGGPVLAAKIGPAGPIFSLQVPL